MPFYTGRPWESKKFRTDCQTDRAVGGNGPVCQGVDVGLFRLSTLSNGQNRLFHKKDRDKNGSVYYTANDRFSLPRVGSRCSPEPGGRLKNGWQNLSFKGYQTRKVS